MRVLITGGCGFIGSSLVEFHLKKNDEVVVVDDNRTAKLSNIENFINHPGFRFEKSNLLSWKNLDRELEKVDRVYHLAAVLGVFNVLKQPIETLKINIEGTERLLAAVAKLTVRPRLLITSSSSVYGCNGAAILREDDDMEMNHKFPISSYAISKMAQESIALGYNKTADIPLIIVRFFNVIGLRQTGLYGMVVPRFVHQAMSQEPLTVFGDGKQTRSFCDVRDAVAAMDLLMNNSAAIGQIVNVGRDIEITIEALAKLVIQKTQSKSTIQYIPYEEAYGEYYVDYPQRKPCLDKLYQLTGYRAKWRLEDTIDNLIQVARKL